MKKEKVNKYDNLTEDELRVEETYIKIGMWILSILSIILITFDIIFFLIPTLFLTEPIHTAAKPIIYIYTQNMNKK